jgi:hypothetical protein
MLYVALVSIQQNKTVKQWKPKLLEIKTTLKH